MKIIIIKNKIMIMKELVETFEKAILFGRL